MPWSRCMAWGMRNWWDDQHYAMISPVICFIVEHLQGKQKHWLVVWNINFIFPYIGNFIIPTDWLIFFRGVGIPRQSSDCLSPAALHRHRSWPTVQAMSWCRYGTHWRGCWQVSSRHRWCNSTPCNLAEECGWLVLEFVDWGVELWISLQIGFC